jgi:HAMP domain-containing protein
MDFVVDNAVQLSAVTLGVLVVAGLAVLGIAGFRLWRVVRAAQKRVEKAGAELAAEGDRLQASLDALPGRQAEVQAAIASLQRRVAVLGVLSSSAGQAADVLRAPLRYLGR